MDNKISVVITTCSRYNDLLACIRSVMDSTLIPSEVIIIDDASTDETKDLNAASFNGMFKNSAKTGFVVVHHSENLKMVKARNDGAKAARGDYVLFIDDDNEIDKEMIRLLAEFALLHPEAGIVGPGMFYFKSGKKYLDYQRINFFTGKTKGYIERSNKEFYLTDGVPNVFLIKKEVFNKCGYFDEKLIQTFTEPDFAFSARKCGFEAVIVEKAKTFHKVDEGGNLTPRGLGGAFKQKAYCTMRNRMLIIFRYGNFIQKLVYLLLFSWAWALMYSALMLPYGRFDLIKLYWYGWKDGLIYAFTGRLNNSLPGLLK